MSMEGNRRGQISGHVRATKGMLDIFVLIH